jgi:hypothetical protein
MIASWLARVTRTSAASAWLRDADSSLDGGNHEGARFYGQTTAWCHYTAPPESRACAEQNARAASAADQSRQMIDAQRRLASPV